MARYVIVDYMHRVYKTMVCTPLSTEKRVMGEVVTIDTTIPNYTIKSVWQFSGRGSYPIVVCLEGGCPARVNYFAQGYEGAGVIEQKEGYKDGRGKLSQGMRDGINRAVDCMLRGGVACAREVGYEADDYIYTIVQALKASGVKDPIDIITGDRDMLPLVDDQVSVYINNPRAYHELSSPSLSGYFQVTPNSWDTYVGYASEYKGYDIPYNAVLLYKMLKGDKSDNIKSGISGYGAKKFSATVQKLRDAGCDFSSTFRYGKDFDTEIAPVLEKFFTPDEVLKMRYVYNGINLMLVRPANNAPITMPRTFNIGTVQPILNELDIHLPF